VRLANARDATAHSRAASSGLGENAVIYVLYISSALHGGRRVPREEASARTRELRPAAAAGGRTDGWTERTAVCPVPPRAQSPSDASMAVEKSARVSMWLSSKRCKLAVGRGLGGAEEQILSKQSSVQAEALHCASLAHRYSDR